MAMLAAPILFVAVIIFVAYPFLTDAKEAAVRERKITERERLFKKKSDVIANLKDIEMDFQMGKLSQSDYESLKGEYEHQAVAVFQEMEASGINPREESPEQES